ncbi:hypothetical protein E2C01_070427 [Portunus trituberculatus]|uniref:Uncharacterized protein n=1 Tax=Portunus trituberculatus TaxID=210409 RepID=A0A5B7I233_PORTR|nr:hypothetical protein [Portunus trituberculatus]
MAGAVLHHLALPPHDAPPPPRPALTRGPPCPHLDGHGGGHAAKQRGEAWQNVDSLLGAAESSEGGEEGTQLRGLEVRQAVQQDGEVRRSALQGAALSALRRRQDVLQGGGGAAGGEGGIKGAYGGIHLWAQCGGLQGGGRGGHVLHEAAASVLQPAARLGVLVQQQRSGLP